MSYVSQSDDHSHELPLRVLMVTSEVAPSAKTGGLGDMVAALSRSLASRGADVRILIPRYGRIDSSRHFRHPAPLHVAMPDGDLWAAILESSLGPARVYYLDHAELYDRPGIYGRNGGDYADNARRFAVLARAAFATCRLLQWTPHIIHAHDWAAAPSLALLAGVERRSPFERTAGVLTIHNIGYAGTFSPDHAGELGLSDAALARCGFIRQGGISFLQAGITAAEAVTTVSPSYAREVTETELGFGLQNHLAARTDGVEGILNGMDYDEWNPATDYRLAEQYDSDTLGRRPVNTAALRQALGLPDRPDLPLFGSVARLVDQKGFEELLGENGCLPELLARGDAQFAFLGTGMPIYEDRLRELQKRYPDRLAAVIRFDDDLAHLFEAGSDFFLMPSRYEPCGLNQMYSLRYGALPIVTRTGGLADTVRDISEPNGTGIVIEPANPRQILEGVLRACELWRTPGQLLTMRKRSMQVRFTWDSSAARYEDVYRRAQYRRTRQEVCAASTGPSEEWQGRHG